jgi:hypothetical protein
MIRYPLSEELVRDDLVVYILEKTAPDEEFPINLYDERTNEKHTFAINPRSEKPPQLKSTGARVFAFKSLAAVEFRKRDADKLVLLDEDDIRPNMDVFISAIDGTQLQSKIAVQLHGVDNGGCPWMIFTKLDTSSDMTEQLKNELAARDVVYAYEFLVSVQGETKPLTETNI